MLACRWRHRGSTDIDVLVTGPDSLKKWMEGQPRDGAVLAGGEWANPSEEHLRIVWESGSLDVTASEPRPRSGALDARIGPAGVKVLTTTQILRGKLIRGVQGRSPVRDLFDFATAAEKDPEALAEAVGMLRRSDVDKITKNWAERAGEYASRARAELRATSGRPIDCPMVAAAAGHALEDHKTIRVEVRTNRGGGMTATRTLRNGGKVTHTLDPDAPEQSAEACGLAAYMAHNEGSTIAEALGRWRSGPGGKQAGVVYDSQMAPPGMPEVDRDPFAGLGRPKDKTIQRGQREMEDEIKERWMRLQDPAPGRERLVALLKRRVRMERSEAEQRAAAEPPALPDRGSGYVPNRSASRQERNGRGR